MLSRVIVWFETWIILYLHSPKHFSNKHDHELFWLQRSTVINEEMKHTLASLFHPFFEISDQSIDRECTENCILFLFSETFSNFFSRRVCELENMNEVSLDGEALRGMRGSVFYNIHENSCIRMVKELRNWDQQLSLNLMTKGIEKICTDGEYPIPTCN